MASTVATTLSSCIAVLPCWPGGLTSPLLLPRPPPPPLPPSRPSSGHPRLVPRPPWALQQRTERTARGAAALGERRVPVQARGRGRLGPRAIIAP
ncbi:MAG: hypothetical protein J3K34DRAFT_419109 [Monoraphidium minutum]|nr:MAG: hypothetical protein J3K34DRAFT_419109 [Monoraphidium minutum]